MYKMPRKFAKKGLKKPKSKSAPRRRLQPGLAVAGGALLAGKRMYNRYKAAKATANRVAKRTFDVRVQETDGIGIASPVVIGKQKTISFQEKVARTIRPPFMWKRNYQWSAECQSGRKAMFSIELNAMTTNDLTQDITSYKSAMVTNTTATDVTLSGNTFYDGAKFYVDKLTEQIKMVNSSSNSVTGKLHLIAYKRDVDGFYGSSPSVVTNPVSMAMYYSGLGGISLQLSGAGSEQSVGNGWTFTNTGSNDTNYAVTHNMPGSSITATGLAAAVDPAFSLFAPHIKDRMSFFFRQVGKSTTFSLKPGQQLNTSYVFNDLPIIHRELQEYVHLAGISYSIVVEFTGGIVGDSTVTTGNGVISTGSCQLSCTRESVRILGLKNMLKTNVVLQTAPATQIAIASQVIINSDTGVSLSGAVIDA